MPVVVTTQYVADRFHRPLSTHELGNVTAWLDDAWAVLVDKRRLLQTWIDGGLVSEATVRRVMTNMVIRKLQNPEGKSSETIDDYSYKLSGTVASGELYVTSDELAQITPATLRTSSVRLVTVGES